MAFRQPIRDTSKMPLALTSSHTFPAVSVAAVLVFILLRLTILSPKARLRAHLARLPILNGSASGEEKRKAFLETAHQLYQAGYQKVCLVGDMGALLFEADECNSLRMRRIACRRRMVCVPGRALHGPSKC
jgi:hypothetical protein